MERRNLQVRTSGMIEEETEKRLMSRMKSKTFFKYFKRDTLSQLLDLGVLRPAKDLSMGMSFIPHLLGQVEYDYKRSTKGVEDFALLCKESGDKIAQRHKDSIKNEMKRRHD
jgi:hypothetical protein